MPISRIPGVGLDSGSSGVAPSNLSTGAPSWDGSGNVTCLSSISVGNATPTTSGFGITFPATQSASSNANTLDDYEEGTWTPTISGQTTAGTGTYSVQNGAYTKIGNRVFFNAYVGWSAHTGTGNMLLSNLPFAAANTNNAYAAVTAYMDTAITLAANSVLQMRTTPDSTNLLFAQYTVGGGNAGAMSVDTNASVMVMGHYFV